MKGLRRSRLKEILDSCRELRVMVLGDFALDGYWYADMTQSELSRETPLYTRPVIREVYSPGASGNVCCNVSALEVDEVFAVTVLGEDWRGKILQERLRENGVNLTFIISTTERVTSTYIKPILQGWDSQQEDSRLDFINRNKLSTNLEEDFIEKIQLVTPQVDVIIIQDQVIQNGVITNRVRDKLNHIAREFSNKIFVADSREQIGEFRNMIVKPNLVEAAKAVHYSDDPSKIGIEDIASIGYEINKNTNHPVFITLGPKGNLVIEEAKYHHLPAAPTKPPIDPVGAGDTFISAVSSSLGGGANPEEASIIANLAASVTIKKLNTTGTASPKETLSKFDEIAQKGVWP